VDDVVKARLDITMQEENEKKLRKNNVILFGLEESSAAEGEVRIADDTEAMQMILRTARCDGETKQIV